MKLIIKGKMPTANEYISALNRNRFVGAKIKKQETERVYWECKKQKLKPLTKKPTEAIFTWYHKNRKKDMDNVEFAQKFIWDGMVLAKIFKGDGQKYLPAIRSHWHYIDAKNEGVEVELL